MNRKCDFCNDEVAEYKRAHNQQVKYVRYKYAFLDMEEVIEGNACFDCYEFITVHDDQIVLLQNEKGEIK